MIELNAIPGELVYQVLETLNGHVVIAQQSFEIYDSENDISETPVASGIIVGMGKNRKRALADVDKELKQALNVLTARIEQQQQEGGA